MTAQQEKELTGEPTETEQPPARSEVIAEKMKQLVREGNARRIVVKDTQGRTVLDVPVNAGVVAAVLAPVMTAAGAIAALAGPWSIKVDHRHPPASDEEKSA